MIGSDGYSLALKDDPTDKDGKQKHFSKAEATPSCLSAGAVIYTH